MGRPPARGRGSRRAVGRRRVLPRGVTPSGEAGPAVDGDDAHAADAAAPRARPGVRVGRARAVALVAENGRWEHAGQRFFDGEVEPCINGRTIETGAYFGVDVAPIVERILGERLADGGWNCEAENGSVRSSFDTTINVLDGLLAFERATGGYRRGRAARRGGEEYLLERSLFRRKSTGEVVEPAYLEFAFPYYWHYDVLRALDYFRRRRSRPGPAMAEAVEVVRSKQQPDGRWLLDRIHPGPRPLRPRGRVGQSEPLEHAAGAARAALVGRQLTSQLFAFTFALRIRLIAALGTFWSNLIWNVSLRTL